MSTPGNDSPTPPPEPPVPTDADFSPRPYCPDCRPKKLERFVCRNEGIAEQAKYADLHKDGPSPEKYETARLKYGIARHEAAATVKDVRDDLAKLIDQIRCLIDDDDVTHLLDRAWRTVRRRLRRCGPVLGCCVDDDDHRYDTDVEDCGIEVIKARITEYEERATDAEACFARLEAEPDTLKTRVADLRAKVDAIKADCATPDDLRTLYARALAAEQDLEDIWWGFDHIHDFVDCLCTALRISLEARAAAAVLTGELAERICRRTKKAARCKKLRDDVVDAIIEEYVRRSLPRHSHDTDQDDDYDDHDHDHDDHDHYHDHDPHDHDHDHVHHYHHDRHRDRDHDRDHDRDRDRDRDPDGDHDHRDPDRPYDRDPDRGDPDRPYDRDRGDPDRPYDRDPGRDRGDTDRASGRDASDRRDDAPRRSRDRRRDGPDWDDDDRRRTRTRRRERDR